MLIPRDPVPDLIVPTLAHGVFNLKSETPQNFSLIVFSGACTAPFASSTLKNSGSCCPICCGVVWL